MILKKIIKSLSFLLIFIPIVLSSECDNIDSSLSQSVKSCTANEEGKISGLTISNYELNEDQINKLLSYDLTELNYIVDLGTNMYDPLSFFKDNAKFPAAIKNLKNLQSLYINCESLYSYSKMKTEDHGLITLEKDFFKDLKKLKSLKIRGIKISQDNIDDISTLDNLESLTFLYSYLDESLNYKSLSNLKKLSKLEVNNITGEYRDHATNTYYNIVTPKDLVNSNKGIKELYMYPVINININDLPLLEKISFTFDKKDLDASFLEQFTNLTDLNISYFNRNEDYYGNISADLSKLKNLKTLHMNYVRISEEVMSGIENIPNLDELYLQNCILCESFPEKLKNLKSLSVLLLENCNVKDMNIDISLLTNLRKLVINGYTDEMENIPEGVYSLNKLEYLDISVKNVSEKLGNLVNLQHLDLSSGELENIPEQIGNLKNLKYLDLSHNLLTEIPEQLGNLINLEYLDLSQNNINNIPDQIGNLINLKHLNYEENQLKALNDQLKNLKNLEYINFNFNQIYDNSPEYLNDFKNLKVFTIEGNHNLKGKVLTNENLIVCEYGFYNNKQYDLCIPKNVKEIKCLSKNEQFKTCEDEDNNQDDITESTNGLCGKEHGKCPDGQCCNKDGKCGTTEDYCLVSKSCQIIYGHCKDECSEINEKLNVKHKCSVNNEGKAVSLDIDVTYIDKDNLEFTQSLINQLPNFHNIETLILEEFNLNYINLEPLEKMENLMDLSITNKSHGTDVYGKKTGEIPKIIFTTLNNLKKLTILNNYIKSIPDDISTLKNLEYLDLSDNLIEEISPKIGELQNLKEINLSKNKIKNIPTEFGNLKKLEILNLRSMETIRNYSNFIGGLESLKVLDLTYNSISSYSDNDFPKEIGNLTNLEELYLPSNWMRELPQEFENLKNLRILDLRNNQLSEIPEFLKNMEKLEFLDLSENLIDNDVIESFKATYLNKKSITTTISSTTTTNNSITSTVNTATTDKSISSTTITTNNNNSVSSTISTATSVNISTTTSVNITTTNNPVSSTVSITTTNNPVSSTVSITTTNNPVSSTASITTTDKAVPTVTITTTNNPVSSTVSITTTDKAVPTVVKGKCGEEYGKCPDGYCCSKYGWCGKSDDHCAISKGCKSEFGICNNSSTTTTIDSTTTKTTTTTSVVKGKCGEEYGKCPDGYCCSKYGWCGKSDDHCAISKGCKSEFGICNNSSVTTIESTTTKTTTTTSIVEGRCGKGYGNCPTGQCCSKYGWCGKGYSYCANSEGCQSDYGLCSNINSSLEGKCGKEYGSCPSGQCCSKYGWCGTSLAYCGPGCQSEFGKCD